jgi:hypothetical protein
MPNDKQQRARRRARNSQAPDLFRRAAETDTTLRKSTASEAPSSRRGAAAIGAPSSRRGSQAAKRREGAGPAAGRPPEEGVDFDATPANEQKAGTISERRPKAGPDSSAEGTAGRAAVLPGDEVVAPAEAKSPSSRAPLIGAVVAVLGVAVALLLWKVTGSPDAPVTPTSNNVEAPVAPTQVALTPTAAPPPEIAAPAPTATAAADDASTTKDGKKKKKKPVTTAKAPATSAPTAAPTTTPPPPAFQFQFD